MNKIRHKFTAIIILTTLLIPARVSAANDTAGHWAEEIINHSINQGYIKGYEDGSFRPNAPIKRAEFVALANKCMGYAARGTVNFTDVRATDWFYDDVGIAQREGYISGLADGTFRPNDTITRETAAVMAAKMLHLNQNTEYSSYFTDSGKLSWSKGYVGAAVKAKIISGYSNGSFGPGTSMTRAEAVSLINRVAGRKYDNSLDITSGYKNYYTNYDNYDSSFIPENRLNYQSTSISTTTQPDKAGNYRLYNGNYGSSEKREEFLSNVLYDPRTAGLVKNIYVDGNFELSTSIYADSELVLENVKITGKLIVYGLGKVTIKDSDIAKLECRSSHSSAQVIAKGNAVIDETRIYNSVRLVEDSLTNGKGFRNIIFDESCRSDVSVPAYGDYGSIVVNGSKAKLTLERGTTEVVEINEKGQNCIVDIQRGAKINYLDVKSSCYIEGYGLISLAKVSASGATFDIKPLSVSGTVNPTYTQTAHDSTASEEEGMYKVDITVVDKNGKILQGVYVQLGTFEEKYTLSDGKVIFPDVPKGTYRCVLSLPYLKTAVETVTIPDSGLSLTLRYDAEERYNAVFTLKDGTAPVANVTVNLKLQGQTFSKVTGADGKVKFEDVIPGDYTYDTSDYSGKTASGTLTVKNLNVSVEIDFSKI